jgi:hypothetical protein
MRGQDAGALITALECGGRDSVCDDCSLGASLWS